MMTKFIAHTRPRIGQTLSHALDRLLPVALAAQARRGFIFQDMSDAIPGHFDPVSALAGDLTALKTTSPEQSALHALRRGQTAEHTTAPTSQQPNSGSPAKPHLRLVSDLGPEIRPPEAQPLQVAVPTSQASKDPHGFNEQRSDQMPVEAMFPDHSTPSTPQSEIPRPSSVQSHLMSAVQRRSTLPASASATNPTDETVFDILQTRAPGHTMSPTPSPIAPIAPVSSVGVTGGAAAISAMAQPRRIATNGSPVAPSSSAVSRNDPELLLRIALDQALPRSTPQKSDVTAPELSHADHQTPDDFQFDLMLRAALKRLIAQDMLRHGITDEEGL